MSKKPAVPLLPATVKVGGFVFKVVPWSHQVAAEHRCFGEFAPVPQEIRIDETLRPQKRANTLIHELVHVIAWSFDLRAKDCDEERWAITIANGLSAIFMDNPELLEWLAHCTKEESNGA